jgi:hypothetical protein
MRFTDYLVLAVVGYGVALVLFVAGRRVARAGAALRIAAGVVAAVTTVGWVAPAALAGGALGGVFTFVLLFVVLPVIVIFAGMRLGRYRKQRAGDVDLPPIWPSVLVCAFGLAFLLPGAIYVLNAVLYLLGVRTDVDLMVTSVSPWDWYLSRSATVSGDYGDGLVDQSVWWSSAPLPEQGETIRVALGPLWPNPMIESPGAAGVMLAINAALVLPGAALLYLGRRQARGRLAR